MLSIAFGMAGPTGGDNLPSVPSSAANSLGWSNDLSGNSIKWTNSSGTALAPGASATVSPLSAALRRRPSPRPLLVNLSPMLVPLILVEGAAGDSTAVFSPTLVSATASTALLVPTVTATIFGVAADGAYDYTITLQNTGTNALNSFWYGWTDSGNNLPSIPSSAGNSLGWSNALSGNSIKWTNSSGTALAPGASASFTFVSSSSPSAITASPSGESVAYVGAIDFSEDAAGDSTAVFSPTLVSPPPPPPRSAYGHCHHLPAWPRMAIPMITP
jgi:hypothetical protein